MTGAFLALPPAHASVSCAAQGLKRSHYPRINIKKKYPSLAFAPSAILILLLLYSGIPILTNMGGNRSVPGAGSSSTGTCVRRSSRSQHSNNRRPV